ncbi:MAG TPA: glutamine amidotransferase, partial [Alphaproteobacteria bacterium]|nr:glutamine amidotransferase [Alphaproteobacteria bacterium]
MATRTLTAIRHVHFEDLGAFAAVFQEAGFSIRILDAGADDLRLDPLGADILVVLGAPIGVYQTREYPFLIDEINLLEKRMAAELPTLGFCLGAQLMARALGAKVYPGPAKEIGWGALTLTDAGSKSPLHHLKDVPVLHWHGDTFDLPKNAELLASTAICKNQAFSLGPNILGFQCHPEADGRGIERWLIGHACE